MRNLIKKLWSNKNFSFTRITTVRYASSNEKPKEETVKTEEIRKSNVTFIIKKINTYQTIMWNCTIFYLFITDVVIEKHGGITTLNIDRQSTRNSLDEATLKELSVAIESFDKDSDARVLVFYGEGGSFCSGFDIDEIDSKGYNTIKDAAVSIF